MTPEQKRHSSWVTYARVARESHNEDVGPYAPEDKAFKVWFNRELRTYTPKRKLLISYQRVSYMHTHIYAPTLTAKSLDVTFS
jgi:hypothetical protein